MRKGLELNYKSLDADAEKNGAKEVKYPNGDKPQSDDKRDSYDWLFLEELTEEGKIEEKPPESQALAKGLKESEEPENYPEIWDASDLGRNTINVPTPDKNLATMQEENMQPLSHDQFQEISDDLDPEDEKMNALLAAEAAELEGIF